MADEMALAVAGDGDNKISLAEIVKSLQLPEGYNLDNLKPIITGGADHYWPAEPGMLLCGVLLEVNERPTSLVINGQAQNARFYTI